MTSKSSNPKTMNPVASFRDQLLAEEPKIEAALKNYLSWIVASSSSSSTTTHPLVPHNPQQQDAQEPIVWTMQTALTCTRQLSKAINAHIVPITYDKTVTPVLTPDSIMAETAARVWNELAGQTGTKITKILGRTALQHVWKDINVQAVVTAVQPGGDVFVQTFAQLLFDTSSSSDAVLIWGGPAALAHRAAQRQANAAQRIQEEQAKAAAQIRQAMSTPIIEELPNDQADDDDEGQGDAKKPAAK